MPKLVATLPETAKYFALFSQFPMNVPMLAIASQSNIPSINYTIIVLSYSF